MYYTTSRTAKTILHLPKKPPHRFVQNDSATYRNDNIVGSANNF